MELAGYDFRKASAIDAWRNADGSVRTYTFVGRDYANIYDPHSNPNGRHLHAYGHGPFIYVDLDPLPAAPACYVIARAETILYVGMTQNLDQRWEPLGYGVISVDNCFPGRWCQTTNCRVNNLIGTELLAGNALALWLHETATPAPVEVDVYRACEPPWNVAVPM